MTQRRNLGPRLSREFRVPKVAPSQDDHDPTLHPIVSAAVGNYPFTMLKDGQDLLILADCPKDLDTLTTTLHNRLAVMGIRDLMVAIVPQEGFHAALARYRLGGFEIIRSPKRMRDISTLDCLNYL